MKEIDAPVSPDFFYVLVRTATIFLTTIICTTLFLVYVNSRPKMADLMGLYNSASLG